MTSSPEQIGGGSLEPKPDNHASREIASRLREARGDETYSQLAECLGMNAETLRRQSQQGQPSHTLLRQLALLRNISSDWILTGAGSQRRHVHDLSQVSFFELVHELSLRCNSLRQAWDEANEGTQIPRSPGISTEEILGILITLSRPKDTEHGIQ